MKGGPPWTHIMQPHVIRLAEDAAHKAYDAWEPADGFLQLAYMINTSAARVLKEVRDRATPTRA